MSNTKCLVLSGQDNGEGCWSGCTCNDCKRLRRNANRMFEDCDCNRALHESCVDCEPGYGFD